MLFYLNLTEQYILGGQLRPAMITGNGSALKRQQGIQYNYDGKYW